LSFLSLPVGGQADTYFSKGKDIEWNDTLGMVAGLVIHTQRVLWVVDVDDDVMRMMMMIKMVKNGHYCSTFTAAATQTLS